MSLQLLIFTLASWTISANPPPADTSDIDEQNAEALAEIIARDALMQEQDLSPTDDAKWVLHDLLFDDFAQTKTISHQVKSIIADREELLWPRQFDWMLNLKTDALAARLRLMPAHQAIQAQGHLAFDIPIVDHPLVDSYIDYFTGRGRWFFERWLSRSDRYIPIMQPILEKHGLPKDLVFVAMVESGFSATATSWAKAGGFWQFMPATARVFHLRRDAWVDERRDFIRATEAAATYFSKLYREFGDWHLAWAGYNAGEGRVRRTMAKVGVSNFWALVRRKALPKETQHYVPKIIAAAIIAKDRKKYGFAQVKPLSPLAYDEIEVNDATELQVISRQFGCSYELLQELNPGLSYGVTPPQRSTIIRVPKGRGEEIASWLKTQKPEECVSYARHIVERGESLARIARRYGSTIKLIREFNRINDVRSLRPGDRLIIPVTAQKWRSRQIANQKNDEQRKKWRARQIAARWQKSAVNKKYAPKKFKLKRTAIHKVRRGETLWSISQQYGVSVDQMKSWNDLPDNQVQAGAVLEVYAAVVPKS
ncbi:MAG: LysM peptidoglycan-binding domain-containing protein [Deltaproteobacteria bacterium]|nr:LysM peptidoglycan-binding domain-containing protein [Deltaproteobacteria bacterium]